MTLQLRHEACPKIHEHSSVPIRQTHKHWNTSITGRSTPLTFSVHLIDQQLYIAGLLDYWLHQCPGLPHRDASGGAAQRHSSFQGGHRPVTGAGVPQVEWWSGFPEDSRIEQAGMNRNLDKVSWLEVPDSSVGASSQVTPT